MCSIEVCATDFQRSESFHTIEEKESPLLRVYSSIMATRVLSLPTKKNDMLRQLVTHVPDFILNRLLDSKMEPPVMEKQYGTVMIADVSGM